MAWIPRQYWEAALATHGNVEAIEMTPAIWVAVTR
jgi:hypothetical protein